MSPEYFHNSLTYYEARDYLSGHSRKQRASWEQTRLLADVIARCAGNKDGIQLELPWDSDRSSSQKITEDDRQRMQQAAEEWTAILNRKHGKLI